MTQIISVSVLDKDKNYLDDNDLSPSSVLRAAVDALRQQNEKNQDKKEAVTPEAKLKIYQKKYAQALKYLEREGKFDEFLAIKNTGALDE